MRQQSVLGLGACRAESGTKGVGQKVKGRNQADPSSITAYGELPLRNNGRRRWRLAFAVLGIGSDAEESKHRSRLSELFHERLSFCHDFTKVSGMPRHL